MSGAADYCLGFIGIPFIWGKSDCANFAAGWAVQGLGAADIPFPRLASAREWAALCRQRGMVDRARDWAGEAGLVEAGDAPREGDIGIVSDRGRIMFAICAGAQWAVRSDAGIALIDAPHHAIFRAA
ncbi:MAG: hypothetical protein LCH38_10765 [Proteobacteria bacterium]|nr:hypothetical protein [Pseudomonadota bacterium]